MSGPNVLFKKMNFFFLSSLDLFITLATDQEEKDCHRPMSAERMLKNHARACRKLALPLQPYVFDDFFLFPTDSMLHTPGICEETKIANFLIFIS